MAMVTDLSVRFDEATGRWRVVDGNGSIIKDGFATDAPGWKWADAHSDACLKN